MGSPVPFHSADGPLRARSFRFRELAAENDRRTIVRGASLLMRISGVSKDKFTAQIITAVIVSSPLYIPRRTNVESLMQSLSATAPEAELFLSDLNS